MENRLTKKLRRPASQKVPSTVELPLLSTSLNYPQQTPDGSPTFAGAYRDLFPQFCRCRGLAKSTAENYDSIMVRYILSFFDDTTAFPDLDETDFREVWKKICAKKLPKYACKVAAIVIRGIVETGFLQNRTMTILWGIPEYQSPLDSPSSPPSRHVDSPEDEGAVLAERGIRTRWSISLETEIRLVWNMLEQCDLHGELYAGLIMLLLGARTSEATGFSWKHLQQIAPGYWALVRYDVSKHSSRETEAGGKTDNAFRLLPLPRFLVEKLLKRKKMLEELYPGRDIGDLPIACRGEAYTVRCTQKELNQIMKYQYQIAGVDEDLVRRAYEELQFNSPSAADCEASVTAYLCRHMFATAMVYCGLTLGEIYTVMGHKEEDENVVKADFSNPDTFRRLADKMNRRPITQLFDRQCAAHTYQYDTPNLCILDDGDVEIRFSEETDIQMTVVSREYGAPLTVQCEQFRVSHNIPVMLPQKAAEDTICIRTQLFQCAEAAYQKVFHKDLAEAARSAQPEESDGRCPEPVIVSRPPLARPADLVREPLPPRPVPAPPAEAAAKFIRTPETPAEQEVSPPESASRETAEPVPVIAQAPAPVMPSPPVPEKSPESVAEPEPEQLSEPAAAVPPEPEPNAAIPEKRTSSAPLKSASRAGTSAGRRKKSAVVYLQSSDGALSPISLPEPQNRNTRGKRITQKGITGNPGILCHDPRLPALVLSRSGTLFRLPTRKSLDFLCSETPDAPAVQALRNGGILLQDPAFRADEWAIVCLANTGAVRKVSAKSLRRFSPKGRLLVELQQGESIVSACLCRISSDVLLFSRQGKALRLTEEHLVLTRTPGRRMSRGIALDPSDQAVACIPYHPGKELVIVKQSGLAVRLADDFRFLPHRKNTSGAAAVKAQPEDGILAVLPADRDLLLLSSTGHALRLPAPDIPCVRTPSAGFITAKLRKEARLQAVAGIPPAKSSLSGQ